MSYFVIYCYLFICWGRELFFLLSFICNYVVSVLKGFLFLLVLGIGCVVLLWHNLCLPYNHSAKLRSNMTTMCGMMFVLKRPGL